MAYARYEVEGLGQRDYDFMSQLHLVANIRGSVLCGSQNSTGRREGLLRGSRMTLAYPSPTRASHEHPPHPEQGP
jgi:hypothetical protein